MSPQSLLIVPLDLSNPAHSTDLLALLQHYANDPMGGSKGLSEEVQRELVGRLRQQPAYYGALAYQGAYPGDEANSAIGLINCFTGFSTFAAAPLLNVHDLVVHHTARGKGVAQALLAHVSEVAMQRGCCKLTLEVLSNNAAALQAYQHAGFRPYVLDPAAGQALFLQKLL